MTTTPLATIADALIEFILSLLRDPEAAAKFADDPDASLSRAGLQDVCAADVRSVMPVIAEHPQVIVKTAAPLVAPKPAPSPSPSQPSHRDPDVIQHINHVANNFQFDNRSTIVDQSVNQNIWAEGDVTQIFDQEAVMAVGDNSVAAGRDAAVDTSTTDITAGDIAIGNTDAAFDIDDSFNDSSTNVDLDQDAEVDRSFNDSSTDIVAKIRVKDSGNVEVTETETTDVSVVNSATAADSYDEVSDAASSSYTQSDVDVEEPEDLLLEEI